MATRPIPGNRNHPILPFKFMKSTSLISLLALALLCWASPGLAQTTTVTPSTTTLLPQGGDITFSVNANYTDRDQGLAVFCWVSSRLEW